MAVALAASTTGGSAVAFEVWSTMLTCTSVAAQSKESCRLSVACFDRGAIKLQAVLCEEWRKCGRVAARVRT